VTCQIAEVPAEVVLPHCIVSSAVEWSA
jgi:hypothetical protein